MAQENKVVNLNPDNEASSKIETIKNLIFGDNMLEYEREFQELKKDLVAKRKELEDFIEVTKKELISTIDSLNTDLNIRITDLEETLLERAENIDAAKVDKDTLGKLLVSIGEKISQK